MHFERIIRKMRIGFMGLGRLGRTMVKSKASLNLMNDHKVFLYNRTIEKGYNLTKLYEQLT